MKRTQLFNLILLSISALFMGCGTSIRVPVIRPAEINLKGYDTIALGEIKTEIKTQEETTDFKLGPLSINISRKNKDKKDFYFSSQLTQALKATRFKVLSYDGLSTPSEGGVAVISGHIDYDYDEDMTKSESKKKDKKTGEVKTTLTYTRKGSATVKAILQVTDGRTKEILTIKDFTREASDSEKRENLYPKSIDKDRLFKSCREQIVQSFIRVIVPYTEMVSVAFETDDKMSELERGYNMVKEGNWDAAIDIFQKVAETYPNSPLVHKAYYNLGVSYMYMDQFDQARNALEEAYARKAEGKYQKAITALNRRIEDKRRLEEQRRQDDSEESK